MIITPTSQMQNTQLNNFVEYHYGAESFTGKFNRLKKFKI